MADLRAEQILAAVVTTLTGLATTGTNVYRGRVYPFQAAQLPGLAVYLGPDELANELQSALLEWDLTIRIESYVQSSSAQVDTTLNLIRKEVHIAMLTDYTQGLSFVQDTTPGEAGEPELSGAGAKPIAVQRLEYVIKYRTSSTDLSA